MPGFPVLHCLPEFGQTHVHWIGDAIQPSHPLLSPSLPAFQSFPTVYWKWKAVVGLFLVLKNNSKNKNPGRHIILDQAVIKGEKQLNKLRWNHRWFSPYMSIILKIISKAGNKLLTCYCFFIILFYFFYFTILYWFCHTSTCIQHGCARVPHPEPPSHLPPHTIPLGHPSAPAPSFLYPASNLDWRFISYMIFICLLPFSQIIPSSLSHRVQNTILYICVSFAVSYTGLSLPSF